MLPDHRERLSSFLKSTSATPPSNVLPPILPEGSLFDFLFDAKTKGWVPWSTLLAARQLPSSPSDDISSIWVDTTESVRISYLVHLSLFSFICMLDISLSKADI